MYIDYMYNTDCESVTVKEFQDGTALAEMPGGVVKRFCTWAGAVNFLIAKGFSFQF